MVRRKTEDYHTLINTPVPSDDELEKEGLRMTEMKRSKKPEASKDTPMDGSPHNQVRDSPDLDARPAALDTLVSVEQSMKRI